MYITVIYIYLTNRFHVAACVCSVIDHRWRQNVVRTKSGTRGVATFWRLLWSITESDARQHGIYLFYIITKILFYFKIFQHNAKAGLLPRLSTKKNPFDVIYDRFKMKQFHWLLSVAKNCDWSRKIAPLSNLTRASLLVECKLTAKQNWTAKSTNLEEKCWKNQVSFCHRSSSVNRKPWTLPWKLQELKKIPSENLRLRST